MENNTITSSDQLRTMIISKYRSVRAFCNANNIAYTTVDNIFRRGVGNVNAGTAKLICDILNLDIGEFCIGRVISKENSDAKLPSEELQLINKWRMLSTSRKALLSSMADEMLKAQSTPAL